MDIFTYIWCKNCDVCLIWRKRPGIAHFLKRIWYQWSLLRLITFAYDLWWSLTLPRWWWTICWNKKQTIWHCHMNFYLKTNAIQNIPKSQLILGPLLYEIWRYWLLAVPKGNNQNLVIFSEHSHAASALVWLSCSEPVSALVQRALSYSQHSSQCDQIIAHICKSNFGKVGCNSIFLSYNDLT